jgi:hypothetical protein
LAAAEWTRRHFLAPTHHTLVTLARVSALNGVWGLSPGSLVVTATSSEPSDSRGDGHTALDTS